MWCCHSIGFAVTVAICVPPNSRPANPAKKPLIPMQRLQLACLVHISPHQRPSQALSNRRHLSISLRLTRRATRSRCSLGRPTAARSLGVKYLSGRRAAHKLRQPVKAPVHCRAPSPRPEPIHRPTHKPSRPHRVQSQTTPALCWQVLGHAP